ncbi:MAG: 30S ribosomal protein S8 [Candidatus Yanofskybacteria bacterium RIFCSPLOWO2_01_FULL_49_17]|uniref:Small ribosomal subunit protein uS8 n=1 Tax=Candidatus Yanofskybacteria bacterium RIFCSPLOWO2_01_FULL_49_17 TaxID=1802700 RepID=A0A1F8GRM2_9BACT|nr:MAG: 30S ribosomal protein S8 [Candidatus Yanofskybacteria bacterium RIFCSPLOWO2_01_FULL_49_17]
MDPISDMLNRIKTASMARQDQVMMPFSKMKLAIADVLLSAGYISGAERKSKKHKKSEHEYLLIGLKYNDGTSAISGIRMISRQSRRMYLTADEIKPVRSGHGLAILSTSKGVMSSRDARKQHVGGEIICEIW